jgi:HAD superfamily hydrolase (TIGR01509 family)
MIDAKPDWSGVDHVLLDMDGTILDLAFDNYFWNHLLPERYGQVRGMSLDEAQACLRPRFLEIMHTLPWYSVDHWSEQTGLDLAALKREARERIVPLAGAVAFLHAVRRSGRELWLVTNAHVHSWSLKLEHTGLGPLFDVIVSSHDYGAPKEDAAFWQRLSSAHPFDPARALFVDDSLPVLRAAHAFGLRELVAIRHPDSTQAPRVIDEFPSIDALGLLLAGLT